MFREGINVKSVVRVFCNIEEFLTNHVAGNEKGK